MTTLNETFPFRLYLLRHIDDPYHVLFQRHDDPFTVQKMTICEIANDSDHVILADEGGYESWTYGTWFYQRWRIKSLTGDRVFRDPRFVGISQFGDPVGDECEFSDQAIPGEPYILELEVRTSAVFSGTNAWTGVTVTVNPDAIDEDPERFGIFAVEWPILTGLQPYSPDALAWPWRNGLLLNDPLNVLFTKGTSEVLFYQGEMAPAPPVLMEKVDVPTVNMIYPNGYETAMQFFTYYEPRAFGGVSRPYGNLWYTSDSSDRTKMKQFRFKANLSDDYVVSFMHYNDDVCGTYIPDSYPLTQAEDKRICSQNDFGPIDYEIRQVHFSWVPPPGPDWVEQIGGNWMEAAKWYRNWVRNVSGGVPWLRDNVALAYRTGPFANFYRYTGYTLFNIGAEFALADPVGNGLDPANDGDNFLRRYRDILYTPAGRTPAMVNYVLGWDFHHVGIPMRRAGAQNAKCGVDGVCDDPWSDWEATFAGPGPEHRLNRDVILPTDSITPPLGYVNPYFFSLHMYYDDNALWPEWDFVWTEWPEEAGEMARTPWLGHTGYVGITGCSSYSKGGCLMDPTQTDFYENFVERSRHLVLDPFDKDPPDENNPPEEDRITGLYHDIGVTFAYPGAFRSHPEFGPIKEHRAGSAVGSNHVGMGGFVWEAERNMIDETRHHPVTGIQDMLLGTEQMTEVFIDLFDYYGAGENSLGPLRPFADPGQDDFADKFAFPDKFIITGDAMEIPMLQYAYHPMMSIRMDGAWFSGGGENTNSTYDAGDIYYWVVARAYFDYGAMIQMFFTESEMDVLTSNAGYAFLPVMPTTTPSYRLGWWRVTDDPEEYVLLDNDPGKHVWNSNERAEGDPAKEAYLRLAAAIRSYIVPAFLAYGEKRTTGIKTLTSQQGVFPYYFFTARGGADFEHCSDAGLSDHCDNINTTYPFSAERVVTGSWQNYGVGSAFKILHIAANLYNETRTFTMVMDRVPEFSGTAYYRFKILSPTTQDLAAVPAGAWRSFNPGNLTAFLLQNMPPHSVALVLLCQNQSCTF